MWGVKQSFNERYKMSQIDIRDILRLKKFKGKLGHASFFYFSLIIIIFSLAFVPKLNTIFYIFLHQ